MKLSELFENLFEAPLPPDLEPNMFDPKPGKYTSKSIITKLEQHGVKVGKGSSRIAFLLHVPASQFPRDVLEKYQLPKSGIVETVLKLALNGRGLSQNVAEIEHFDNYEHWEFSKYLLPILDTSARNKDIHLDDISLSNWIQFPYAPKPSVKQFKTWFVNEFGNIYDEFMRTYQMRDLHKINQEYHQLSEDQQENWNNFLDLLESTGLHPNDLKRPANWGMFGNRLYIVDYGFDASTQGLYNRTEKAEGYVDNSGNIRLNITTLPKPSYRY